MIKRKTKNEKELLLEIGADPFSVDEQGVGAVTKAALENIFTFVITAFKIKFVFPNEQRINIPSQTTLSFKTILTDFSTFLMLLI